MTRWFSRQTTKRGGAWPPFTTVNRIGGPSSATRRQEERINDARILADYVQLKPGVLVIWDRKPHRIVELAERPADLWEEQHEKDFKDAVARWERYPHGNRPEKSTWEGRPFVFVLAPDRQPTAKPLHLVGPYSHSWQVLPEHYCICSACGELPPCSHEVAEKTADRDMARASVLMDIPPGHCLGCGEFVTRRQQAARFPGPNLWRPDMPEHSAVFHARQECSGEVDRYRRQWEERGGSTPQAQLSLDDSAA
ncbi:hypothetical protein ACWGRL_05355 [[Kitasatospora] papulosa]